MREKRWWNRGRNYKIKGIRLEGEKMIRSRKKKEKNEWV